MQQLSSAQYMGIHISQSPRRLRAKYTQYTNFVYALGFRPCRRQSHAKQENLYAVYETTDRIKASVETFGSQPQLYGSIITTAVAVLSLLVSKVLRKAVELSEKLHDTRQEQTLPPEPRPTTLPKAQKQLKPQIPPKPEMPAEAASYPKLHKIYKELVRQNKTISAAEKERNALEDKQASLKGLSKFTKKGELQGEIDRINERIDLLKVGLSGIAKRYGYQTVQDFYRAYHTAKNAYADYQDKVAR